MKLHFVIDIDAPPEKVFYWIENPERAMEWMTSVAGGEIIHKTDGWVGTTFRETVADEGGSTQMHGVVTEYTANQSMGFHLEGKYNDVDVRYRLEPIDGKTRLIQEGEVRFKSITRLLMLILGPFFKSKISKQSMEEFRKLKQLCEQP
jgi:uncharacterized protein YndB with AHSA1/START domain